MKKQWLGLLALLCLSGCQTSTDKPTTNVPDVKEPVEPLTLTQKMIFHGDGNEHGFYHIAMRDIDHTIYTNLYYYDYETKEEIFLCNKPECQHMDASCPAYVQGLSYNSHVFLAQDHLYLIKEKDDSFDMDRSRTVQIIQKDLDGSNETLIATLPAGYILEQDQIALQGDVLYLPLQMNEQFPMQDGVILQVAQKEKLFAIHLSNHQVEEVADFNDQTIIGVKEHQLILLTHDYDQDPDVLLQNKEYDAYDQVMMNARFAYQTYDLTTRTFQNRVTSPTNTQGSYADGWIYEVAQEDPQALIRISMTSGEQELVKELPKQAEFSIANIVDDHIILQAFRDDFSDIDAYVYDTKEQSLTPFTLKTKEPKQLVEVYGMTKNQYFVYYDHDQHREISWAGTEQFSLDKIHMGLIDKIDFWNNQPNFEPISMISQP